MKKKGLDIQSIRESVGWAYEDLKWLTEREAIAAQKERQALLDFLHDKINHSFSGTKIHFGPLSPGCKICGDGFWSCMFLNQLCSADCFFCPQNRKVKKNDLPCTGQGMVFRELEDYVNFLSYANYKGVGFSGGEPFLAFDQLLCYIKKIREQHGHDLYIWVYTNGDFVETENLIRLHEYGLNEIRFNISARNYDLSAVKKAIGIINSVTVEIPAIPEDYEAVKRSLALMKDMGVAYVNLHQLMATNYNYKEYIARNYTFLHQDPISILESELTALRLLKYAVEEKLDLPINYCNSFYKSEFQIKGNRERMALLIKEEHEELTEKGFIRRLAIKKNGATSEESITTRSALRTLDLTGYNLIVRYFEPCLKIPNAIEPDQSPSPFMKDKVIVERKLSAERIMADATGIDSFLRLILEKQDEKEARRNLLENCQATTKGDLRRIIETIDGVISLKEFEHIGRGFPEIF